jgi:hypothetical protein
LVKKKIKIPTTYEETKNYYFENKEFFNLSLKRISQSKIKKTRLLYMDNIIDDLVGNYKIDNEIVVNKIIVYIQSNQHIFKDVERKKNKIKFGELTKELEIKSIEIQKEIENKIKPCFEGFGLDHDYEINFEIKMNDFQTWKWYNEIHTLSINPIEVETIFENYTISVEKKYIGKDIIINSVEGYIEFINDQDKLIDFFNCFEQFASMMDYNLIIEPTEIKIPTLSSRWIRRLKVINKKCELSF